MLATLDVCLARLAAGGCAFFQLPCHLYDYRFDPISYRLTPSAPGALEMHAVPQAQVFAALAKHDLIPVEVVPYPRIGPIGSSYAFLAVKRADAN
jgi:hypothetical protein